MTTKTVTADTLVAGDRIATFPISDRSYRSRYHDYSIPVVQVYTINGKVYVYSEYGRYAIPMIYRPDQSVTIVSR